MESFSRHYVVGTHGPMSHAAFPGEREPIPFKGVFRVLSAVDYAGLFTLELWIDDLKTAQELVPRHCTDQAVNRFRTRRRRNYRSHRMMLEVLREQVCAANRRLPALGLVTWTSGNVSALDPDTGHIVIKPSGRMFDELTPADMVVVDLEGRVVDGNLGPSSDTAAHLYVYAHRKDVGSVVHTHSNYATSFATAGLSIPVYITAIADEFGCEIPLGGYASIGGDAIGQEICRSIGASPAILMKQHGVFTIGPSINAALKAAVMVEDVAKTVWLARQLGPLTPLPDDEVLANNMRYSTRYGTSDASQS